MEDQSLKNIISFLQKNKQYLYDKFGVTSIGIFGSYVRGEAMPSSDLDIVIEMEQSKKNIHNFFQLKRYLEKKTDRNVDLGFECSLKSIIKEGIKDQIKYV